jgi:predicted esterase YcpF (UPF0227 family)
MTELEIYKRDQKWATIFNSTMDTMLAYRETYGVKSSVLSKDEQEHAIESIKYHLQNINEWTVEAKNRYAGVANYKLWQK